MHAVRVVVSGRVQGVGFRYWLRTQARELGVTGSVWNRRDGSVELVAEHKDSAILDRLIQNLGTGPGHVEKVSTQPWLAHGASQFEIGPTE